MKRVFYSILFTACLLLLASCDKELLDGAGIELKWEESTYSTQWEDNTEYFVVPQKGGTFTFVCTNCSLSPTYAQVLISYPGDKVHFEPCFEVEKEIKVEGNKVTVSIPANDSIKRYIHVNFSIINDHGRRRFVQEGVK